MSVKQQSHNLLLFLLCNSALACLLLFCAQLPAASADSLSLATAENQLSQRNWQLQAQRADTDAWQQQAQALRALSLPRLDITVAAFAYEKDLYLYTPQLPEPIAADVFRSGIRPTVNLLWPLYTGGRTSAAQQQVAARVSEAEAEQLQLMQQLSRHLLELYFGQQMLQQVVSVRQQALQVLQQHVHKAKRFEEEGLISQLQRMQAEVAQAEANRELLIAKQQLEDIRAALANLLLQTQPFCLTTPLPEPVKVNQPLAWFIDSAEQHNPALAKLSAKDRQLQQQLKIEQGKLLPEVFVAGAYELNRSATPFTEPDWKVGLGVRWALTTDNDRRSSIAVVENRQQQLHFSRQQAEDDIRLGISSSYRAQQHYLEQFTLLKQDIALASENARLQQAAFSSGMVTSLDVTDSQLKLASAQIQLLQAAQGYINALGQLLQLSGQPSLLSQFIPAVTLADHSCHQPEETPHAVQ